MACEHNKRGTISYNELVIMTFQNYYPKPIPRDGSRDIITEKFAEEVNRILLQYPREYSLDKNKAEQMVLF